ncbi:hypothetical protein PQS91_10635 [Stenotrophomonas geniculata]|uniref:hypothetical protein n=1 Tax=Stenotrophomonas geniculata TaxID=86188 RepID=UPI00234F78D9|nr:hypothetical protein [Stenotrophomonas geniculata]MDC7800304.1 hypothetical protein [Stenotrophomonas geniculata]
MSSPTPIITKPPKQAARSSILPQGLMPIRDTLKHWTTWLWGILLASPDGLYAGAAALGMLADEAMPSAITTFIRVFAGVGLIAKFISQKRPGA